MKLPTNLFLNNVSPRKVYLFSSDKLNTSVPHYFVCMVRTPEEMLILTCCTSQFKKRERFIKFRNLPASTLVYIPPDEENGLTKDTYVDCNSYFDYSIDEIKMLYEEEKLEFKGGTFRSKLCIDNSRIERQSARRTKYKKHTPEIGRGKMKSESKFKK